MANDQVRDGSPAAIVEDFMRDLRYGARALRRTPGFALVAIITLGLGIGAATAVFSVVNGVLLAPLPYPEPDRIVRLMQIDSNGRRNSNVSEPNFNDWHTLTRSFKAMAQTQSGPMPVTAGTERMMANVGVVSREYFDVMGTRPYVGRGFQDEDHHGGAAPVAIISDRFWRTRLRGQPLDALSVRVGDRVHQVVGVLPANFDYPVGTDIWYPRELNPPETSRSSHNYQVVGRLADGVRLEGAVADLSTMSRALKVEHGDSTWMSDAVAVPLREQLTSGTRPALLMLFAAALVLLLIACLNVSNLQLARASTRRRELAIRLAVGAGRGRITRQLFAEALVLAGIASLAGIGLAYGGVRTLVALQPSNLPRVDNIGIDVAGLAFAVLTAVVTAVALGIATAMRASKHDVRETLSEGTRTLAGSRTGERVRHTLVVAQVALTIVLLAGAGLLARSFVNLLGIDPGYRTDAALLVDLQWSSSDDPALQLQRKRTQQQLIERLQAVAGARQVGLINAFPLGGSFFANGLFTEMHRVDEFSSADDLRRAFSDPRRLAELRSRQGMAGYRIASEGYFAAMGIRLIRGRLFEESDGPDAPHVAVISQSLADSQWPGQDPLGRFIQFGNMDGNLRGFRIVGIVSDVREVSPEAVPGPLFYGYYKQRMASRYTVVVRTDAGAALAPTLRQIVREVDPELPVQMRTVEEARDRAFAGRRFSLTLIAVFSLAALILATLGIYGLIAYLVAERTREIGIRLALGAESTDVLRLVLGRGVVLALVGIGVGLAAALGLTRFLEGMLFGVTPTDPLAFGAVMAITMLAVVAASYLPARRAMQVQPVIAMRAE